MAVFFIIGIIMTTEITLQLDLTTDTTGNAKQVARMIGVSAWHISGDYLIVENPLLDYRVTDNETYSHKTDRIPNGAVVVLVQDELKTPKSSQVSLQEGIDKLLETRIPILDQIYELCLAIENCGASPELTDAVTKAGALREPITELVKQAIDLGIGKGIVSVSYSSNGLEPTLDSPEFKNDDSVNSSEPLCNTQVFASGSVGECIHRSKLLNNRENAYLLTQLLNTPNISSDIRKKAEDKMHKVLDGLIQ